MESTSRHTIYSRIWQENAEDDNYGISDVKTYTGTTEEIADYDHKNLYGFHVNEENEGSRSNNSGNGLTVRHVYFDRNVHTFTVKYYNRGWKTYGSANFKYGQSTAPLYNAASAQYPTLAGI